jgi:hypothetical protein
MVKILANDGIDEQGKLILERAGFTVVTEKLLRKNLLRKSMKKDIPV